MCVYGSYAGYSKKGYAPCNPRKRNQDALIMAEDVSTASLFLAVMDGHGEVGDKVAQVGLDSRDYRILSGSCTTL